MEVCVSKKAIIACLVVVVTIVSVSIYAHNFMNTHQKDQDNWNWNNNWNGNGPVKIEDTHSIQIENVKPENVKALNYADALQKSKELNKKIFIIYTADWCKYCQKMKNETLSQAQVIEQLKDYIFLEIDTDKDRSGVKKFGIDGMPSFVVTNYEEEKIKATKGFMDADSFLKWLK